MGMRDSDNHEVSQLNELKCDSGALCFTAHYNLAGNIIMVEQMPSIPLTNEPYWYEYSTAHYTGWPDPSHQYAVPSPFMAPDNEVVLLNLQQAD